MFKRKNKNIESFEEDMMDIATKEDEIMSSYLDDYVSDNNEDEFEIEEFDDFSNEELEEETTTLNDNSNNFQELEEYQDNTDYNDEYDITDDEYEEITDETFEDEEYHHKTDRNYKKLINIIFIIIMVALTMITVDVISVARYNTGPFFAIPLKKYKDGGSKAYYGLGYKVIKYNQLQGRRDKEIGLWNLRYNIEPVNIKDIDLAIEMYNKEIKTYKKYYKKFVRITSTLEQIDKDKNTITLAYTDEGKKYTLEIKCSMASKKSILSKFEKGKETTIIGTITDFKYKSKNNPNILYLSNCFAEQ